MEDRLSHLGITIQQFAVMMMVLENEGMTQTEIGGKFSAPAYSISRALDHLENANYLERRPHPTSRRTHTVHATDQGRALGPELFAIVREVNSELTADLSPGEKKKFQELLSKIA